jgi:glycosyltransferase involved in cell wall biosynthesis
MRGNKQGLALFFTLGVSLVDWAQTGFLEREAAYYRRLSEHVGPITFVTYGGAEDYALQDRLQGIRILANDQELPPEIFARQAARIYQDELQNVGIFKSNQIKGASAALNSAAHSKGAAVVRCGYLLSRFRANRPVSMRMRLGLWRRELALFHQAARVILPTPEDALYARRWYSVPVEKIAVIPNFVDVHQFVPREDVECEPGLIGFVGRLAEQKNVGALIEALAGVHNARLRVIGDGPLRDRLRDQAASLNVELEMLGSVPHAELPRLLAECEIFVLPSLYEGLPKALLEAMSAGVPVIASRVQGSEKIIRHRETGWLCEDTSAATLRRAVESLLADSRLRAYIGRTGRQFVAQNYSLESVLSREVAVYQEMGFV